MDGVKPGQELIILPVDGVLHTVSRGQTLSRIAELYNVSIGRDQHAKHVQGGFIIAGQELIIPGASPIIAAPPPPPPCRWPAIPLHLHLRPVRLRLPPLRPVLPLRQPLLPPSSAGPAGNPHRGRAPDAVR
jgi:LysM repeat protein